MECKNKEQLINILINKVLDENDLCYDIKYNELIDEIKKRINKYLNERYFDYFASNIILKNEIKPKKFYKSYYKNNKNKIANEVIDDLYKKGILYDYDERYKEEIYELEMEGMKLEMEREREEMMKEEMKMNKCIKKCNIQTLETTNNNQLERIENELNRLKERLRQLEEKN